jgi:hypothetical protein
MTMTTIVIQILMTSSYCLLVFISIKIIIRPTAKAMSRFIELPQITGSPVLAAVYKNRLLPR